MTDTLERELRRTLHEQAAGDGAGVTDPWARVQRGLVVRRRRRTAAAAGSLALVVALGGGLAVLQPWTGDRSDQVAQQDLSGWGLDDGTPRGDLGRDEGLRSRVEERVVRELAAQGGQPTSGVEPGTLRLVLAGDVVDRRVVVGVARALPAAGGPSFLRITLTGPAGTDLDGLEVADGGVAAVGASTVPAVSWVTEDADDPRLVAVVPRGARVSVSPAVAVADGLERYWQDAEVSAEGVVEVALDAEPASGLAVLRVDSAPGFDAGSPVTEVALPWPGPFDQASLEQDARDVVVGGPLVFRDSLLDVPDDQALPSVAASLLALGRPSPDDARLLYASAAGADTDRGAGGWSTLVEVPAGGGSVLLWRLHDDSGAEVGTAAAAVPDRGAEDERALFRTALADGTELVGVWDPEGTLGTVTVDGEDAFMPLAVGFRWFPVPSGAEVVVDGEQVPQVAERSTVSWPLPGEVREGAVPQVLP